MPRVPRWLKRAAALSLVGLAAGGGPALAQCAMCGLGAEQAADPDTASRTFSLAVLVLLVPVNLLVAALAWLTWKARDWDGAFQPPGPGGPDQSR